MTVVACVVHHTVHTPVSRLPTAAMLPIPTLALIVAGEALNSNIFQFQTPTLETKYAGGNQTAIAIFKWAATLGDLQSVRNSVPVIKTYPFSSLKKTSSVLVNHGSGARMFIKGAAEAILSRCQFELDRQGLVVPLTHTARADLEQCLLTLARSGLRCIGLAFQEHGAVSYVDGQLLDFDPAAEALTLIALLGLQDPLRPGVPAALATCQRAGIVVRMVTGDNLDTAVCIAREAGLVSHAADVVLTGPQYRLLTEDEKCRKLPHLRVLARSSPLDKETLVRWYKAHGEVVAVTGIGVCVCIVTMCVAARQDNSCNLRAAPRRWHQRCACTESGRCRTGHGDPRHRSGQAGTQACICIYLFLCA